MNYKELIEKTQLDLAVTLNMDKTMLLRLRQSGVETLANTVPDFLNYHIIVLLGVNGEIDSIAQFNQGKFVGWINEDYMQILSHGYVITFLDNKNLEVEDVKY